MRTVRPHAPQAAMLAEDHDALDRVQAAVNNFQSDYDFLHQAERALRALEPDGWRGAEVT